MRKLLNIAPLSVLVLFCACGSKSSMNSDVSSKQASAPIGSNWQLSATSLVHAGLSVQMAGSILQSDHSLTGTLRVTGWNCFDQMTPIELIGTLTDGNLSLTSSSLNDQVITFSGSITQNPGFPDEYAGTYSVTGGCAAGDRGNATGYTIPSLTRTWGGEITTDDGKSLHWDAQLTQGTPTAQGNFAVSGTVAIDDCISTNTITAGTLRDGSVIRGTFVDLEMKTDTATITFLGTADPDGLIRGSYTANGGPCEVTGTAYLSPWEY